MFFWLVMPPLCPDVLATVPSDSLGDLVFTAHPAARIVRSAYPAVAIFAMNRVEGAVTPLQSNAAEDALITRPDMEVAVRLLPPGGAAFLKTLIDGGTLGAAATAAFAETASFDLPASIAGMIDAGVIPCVFWEGDCTSRLETIADIPRGKAIYLLPGHPLLAVRVPESSRAVACLDALVHP